MKINNKNDIINRSERGIKKKNMSLKCLFGHKWNGCKCEKCGKMRDIGHNYVAIDGECVEKCTDCGKSRVYHYWDGIKCKRCGAERNFTDAIGIVMRG